MPRPEPGVRVVRVLPDLPAVDKGFDYLVPAGWEGRVGVGTRVRMVLNRRRVGGWVVATDVVPPAGVVPRPLAGLSGWGPSPEVIELARWAAWRWAGRTAHFLATGSPDHVVRQLPSPGPGGRGGRALGRPETDPGHPGAGPGDSGPGPGPGHPGAGPGDSGPGPGPGHPGAGPVEEAVVEDAMAAGRVVVRLPPATDLVGVAEAMVERCLRPARTVMVLAPAQVQAQRMAAALEARGWPVARLPEGWAAAAAGGRVVVGSRAGAWGPAPGLAGVVVLDAHDQAYRQEQAPTWAAWEVAAERAARTQVPCWLVSPCPTLEMLARARLVVASRAAERSGWAALEVVDRRGDDPRSGLFSERLVHLVRSAGADRPVVCLLNRTGRGRLLACAACGELVRCQSCGGPLAQPGGKGTGLRCGRCAQERPAVCAGCGGQRLKALRVGVGRVREELEALTGAAVQEVSGPPPRKGTAQSPPAAPGSDTLGREMLVGDGERATESSAPAVAVGTEAVLHRLRGAAPAAVAFLDMDQELLAPGFRAGEAALALLARASRLVGAREEGGRLVVQTRLPGHEVLAAAVHADPGRVTDPERGRRASLRLPPAAALALVSGAGAAAYAGALTLLAAEGGTAPDLEVLGPHDGAWLVRAPDHQTLCDALAQVGRPRQRLRVEVDPVRV